MAAHSSARKQAAKSGLSCSMDLLSSERETNDKPYDQPKSISFSTAYFLLPLKPL